MPIETNTNTTTNSNNFNLVINTPKGLFLDKYVSIATFKTTEGYRGIMKDAIEFTAAIVPSKIYLTLDNKKEQTYFIDHGIVHFKNNVLSIIVNDISEKSIEEAKLNAPKDDKYTIIEEIKIKHNIVK